MTPTDGASTEELRRVEELRKVEERLERKLDGLRAKLAEARRQAAEAAVAAELEGKPTPDNDAIARLERRIAVTIEAITAARAQRVEAILAAWKAQAAELRRQAAALIAEAEAIEAKAAEHLAALRAIEGCDYVPWYQVVEAMRSGSAYMDPIPYTLPLSLRLRGQAAGLLRQAAELEARKVQMSGAVDAASRDELFRKIASWDAMKLAPQLHAVREWAERAEAPVLQRLANLPPEHQKRAEVRYELRWRDGEITADSCVKLSVRDPDPIVVEGSGPRVIRYG